MKGAEWLCGKDFNPTQPSILVIDDLMEELCNSKKLPTLFTREMHHKNTVFFRVQNLYKQGKSMRDVALNSQRLILFKSPRDTEQIEVVGRQLGIKELDKAYQEAIKQRYGYLIINLQTQIPDSLRLQTNLFEQHRKILLKK